MIEPITQILVKSGASTADVKFVENGVSAKFANSTPDFTKKVGQFIDTFLFSKDKTQGALEQFAIDTFEKTTKGI